MAGEGPWVLQGTLRNHIKPDTFKLRKHHWEGLRVARGVGDNSHNSASDRQQLEELQEVQSVLIRHLTSTKGADIARMMMPHIYG